MTLVYFSPEAEDDLSDIWGKIADLDEDAADKMIHRISAVRTRLSDFPLSGRPRKEFLPDLRSVPVWPYLIFYHVKPHAVEVVRIINGSRDLSLVFA